MKSRWLKGGLTVFGAVVLSTLSIFAADSLQGIDSNLNFAGVKNAAGCPTGSVPFRSDTGTLCVDMYEASPSPSCLHKNLKSAIESGQNINTKDCLKKKKKGVTPWTYVSLSQAQRLCATAGKRLPTNEEWYRIALGTNADTCTIQSDAVLNTGNETCVSTIGVHDAVGNVWEWVDEGVTGNVFDGRSLQKEGYVTSVDPNGIAISSSEQGDELYDHDYFWSKEEGIFGMIRGGFYGSNQDAGIYTTNASVPTSFATQGVGFRCVKDM